ncbi:MAG: hypothetical protein AAGI03_18430 [Pseudomonadota bacterium]
MNLRTTFLLSILSFGLGGCGEGTAVEEVTDLVERCWEYVDTGDFPGRGLFWVRETSPWRTREDRGASLRIQYGGTSLDDLLCAVSNHEEAWSRTDRDAVFDAIDRAAPAWVASRNDIPINDVRRSNITDGEYPRHLVFRSNSDGRAFLAIHEDADTGFVTVLTGRGAILP